MLALTLFRKRLVRPLVARNYLPSRTLALTAVPPQLVFKSAVLLLILCAFGSHRMCARRWTRARRSRTAYRSLAAYSAFCTAGESRTPRVCRLALAREAHTTATQLSRMPTATRASRARPRTSSHPVSGRLAATATGLRHPARACVRARERAVR